MGWSSSWSWDSALLLMTKKQVCSSSRKCLLILNLTIINFILQYTPTKYCSNVCQPYCHLFFTGQINFFKNENLSILKILYLGRIKILGKCINPFELFRGKNTHTFWWHAHYTIFFGIKQYFSKTHDFMCPYSPGTMHQQSTDIIP